MQRTYKIRLYPAKKQVLILLAWLNILRELYNDALQERRDAYRFNQKSITYYDQAKELNELKKEYLELNQVYSQVLQDILRRLDKAFRNFFRRVRNGKNPRYPRFKSANRFNSFTFPQSGFKLKGGRLHLARIGAIKIKRHRGIPKEGVIKTCAIKRDVDPWFVTFVVDFPDTRSNLAEGITSTNAIGIDVGLTDMITMSNGEKKENPKWINKTEKKIGKEQRRLARKKKSSKNRRKQVVKVARALRKLRRQREDFHHKLSRKLVNKYKLIVFEDLNIRGMVKNHRMAKSIHDASWSRLKSFVSYKVAETGGWMKLVNPKGTQICSRCGKEVRKSLSVRIHKCPSCGLVMDRDENAAINILKRGIEKVNTVGTTGRACSSCFNRGVMTQEATQLVGW
jgi:putative transposase